MLKIFAVGEDGFEFVSDLRAIRSRRLNLMYSASHVSWSPTNGLLADLKCTLKEDGSLAFQIPAV